jgi:signal transduction histidine kinase
MLAALLIRGGETLATIIRAEWGSLLFWALLVVVLSLLPIRVDDAQLTLDDPILLALAFLYPPEVAALVALLASFDPREIRGEVAFSRALFNRVQIGLSVYLAGATFQYVAGGDLDAWPVAAFGTGAAVAAEYLANVLLVSLHTRTRLRLNFRSTVRRLKVGSGGQFLATHLGYGLLALVLSHLFLDVGAWSVAAFLVPILVARQMLIRGEAIAALTEQLRSRERLLEKLSDRILDERRDERQRVAGDLHDDALQALTKICLSVRLLEQQQKAVGPASDDLIELVQVSDSAIESLRAMIRGLKESSPSLGSLIPSLQSLVKDLRLEWKTKIEARLPSSLELEPATQFIAYQFVREALTNALKHAQASLIIVSAQVSSGELAVQVRDDGVGFNPGDVDSSTHFGIGLIEERVQKAGGRVNIQSAPKKGTIVRGWFPLTPR